jgi:colanic acid/amylovoran biosynthesis protein
MGTHNKGAELMLQTILEQFRSTSPSADFAVSQFFGSYQDRAKYGLMTMLPEGRLGRSTLIKWLMSSSFRRTYGLVKPEDITAVLDGSGFAYSDQWGIQSVRDMADRYTQNKQRGIPTILLPQSFGPFTGQEMRTQAKRLFNAVSLIFAREKASFQHICELGISPDQIHLAPDFTNLLTGTIPQGLNLPDNFACIVPNVRMLDKCLPEQSLSYINFLVTAVLALEEQGIPPYILLHADKEDAKVAQEVESRLGRSVPVLSHPCPRVLKGILGKSRLVIGSRFHAIVGALSQGIPVISTGWSHKYRELLSEYGVSEFLVQPDCSPSLLKEKIKLLATEPNHVRISSQLRDRAEVLRNQSLKTFELVFSAIHQSP